MSPASKPAASSRSTQTSHVPDEYASKQPNLFESRRLSGGSRSAPSHSSAKPSHSSPDYTASPSFLGCDPSVSDNGPNGRTDSQKYHPGDAHVDSHHAPAHSMLPQSPIRRVVRAASKSRRRLKVTSADAFTLEAIQRRLNIFRDPNSPHGGPALTNQTSSANSNGVTTSSAEANSTTVSKGATSQSRPVFPNFSPSTINAQSFSPFTFSQNQQQGTQFTRNLQDCQTQANSRQHRQKPGSRRKQNLPPRPASGPYPQSSKAGAKELEEEEERVRRPNARPKSMSAMSNEKGQCSMQEENVEHDRDFCHDLNSTSNTNNNADNSASNPNTTIDLITIQQQEQPYLPRLNSRRRYETRQMLLSFPEHDAATVHKLIAHYNGDHKRVHAKLAQEREKHQQRQQQSQRQSQQQDSTQLSQKQQQQQKQVESKSEQQRKHSNADQLDVPQKRQPPPLSMLNRDARHRKEERLHSTLSEQANVDTSTTESKSRNGSSSSPDSGKQAQITGLKRRRGDSRDTSNSGLAGSDTRSLGFGQIQSPITNFFSGHESTNDHTHGKLKPRLHLRSRLRRARARKWHGHGEADCDAEHDQDSTGTPASVACLSESGNRDESGESSQDDINKGDCTHESDTSTSSTSAATTTTTCSVPVDSAHPRKDKSQADAWERVQVLQKTVSKLEHRLVELEDENRRTRQQISCRLDAAMRDISTIDKRHEGLSVEVEDNLIRVGKTEQYLDAMRRDLLLIVGQRQWAVWRIIRTAINNVLYYFLAYLVPILAFVVRLIRDVVLSVRRRMISSA